MTNVHTEGIDHLLDLPRDSATEQRLVLSMALTALATSEPKHPRWRQHHIAARRAIMKAIRRAA